MPLAKNKLPLLGTALDGAIKKTTWLCGLRGRLDGASSEKDDARTLTELCQLYQKTN